MQQTFIEAVSFADGTISSKQEGAFYFQANFGIIPEKTTSQVTARQEFVSLPMSRRQQKVAPSGGRYKQFDPGG